MGRINLREVWLLSHMERSALVHWRHILRGNTKSKKGKRGSGALYLNGLNKQGACLYKEKHRWGAEIESEIESEEEGTDLLFIEGSLSRWL